MNFFRKNAINQSINQIAVNAIAEWLNVLADAQKFRIIILNKGFFSMLLEFVPDDKLKIVGKEIAKHAAENMRDTLNIPLTPKTAEIYTNLFPDYLSSGKLRWFDNVKIIRSCDKATLKGFHYLGEKFSKLFTYLSQELLETNFDYKLIEESVSYSPNSVFMEFSY